MFSKATFFAAVLAACAGVAQAGPVPLDVWDPKITFPTAGFVWAAGATHDVTWDTSDAPAHISEGSIVVLAKGGIEDNAHPLAQGFDLRSGSVAVTIPADTPAGDDYEIVLFGDSGNLSPNFVVTN